MTQPVTWSLYSRRASAAAPPSGKGAVDYTLMRKARPVDYMLPVGIDWLKRLPEEIRPMALARQYPRIANMLALDWSKPRECASYLSELLIDRRGGRKGFPADVARDLRKLREYYYRQYLSVAE